MKRDSESVSASDDVPVVGRTDEGDLDPVGLKKAFRFAVYASVVLVRASTVSDPLQLKDP